MLALDVFSFAVGIVVLIALVVVSLHEPPDRSGSAHRDRFIPGNSDHWGGHS